jgi:hypothetical protein
LNAVGDRLKAEAGAASVRAFNLRARVFYATPFHGLYGSPIDPQPPMASCKQGAVR